MMCRFLMEPDLWSVKNHTSRISSRQLRGSRSALYIVFQQAFTHALGLWRLCQRSTCHDHRAVNNVNKHSSHLESTGIGATACIHGAFLPDSVVDFQKGEA